jgi:hypothetical protein
MEIETFLKDLESKLPEFVPSSKLVELGVFSSSSQGVQSRKRKQGPAFLKLSSKRLVYPKGPLLAWLRQRATHGI